MDDRMIMFTADELERADLKPEFLHEQIRDLTSAPLYVIRDDLGTPPR